MGRYRVSRISYYKHLLINTAQSVLLVGMMCLLLSTCAYVLFGVDGFILALILTLATCLLTPSVSSGWIMQAYRARPLDDYSFPLGCALVRTLAQRARLPVMPRLYYVPSSAVNAFAVGTRDNAAIAVTDGLLQLLDRRELAGVLAHEISHIEHNDLWIMSLADVLSRLTVIISHVGFILLLINLPLVMMLGFGIPWILIILLLAAPLIVSFLQLALSRVREYDADLFAAHLTEDPAGLASALQKLEYGRGPGWRELFLPGRKTPEPSLLRTHPPTQSRIARLMALYDRFG